jgi:2-polyprenyl-6-methoxyphenol hydroxylase-like FAD-dependent oxidoreductase
MSPIRSSLLFLLIFLVNKSSSLSASNYVALNVPSVSSVSASVSSLASSYSAVHQKKVVIVGGGPVGLATALTLSHPPHSCHVTVLERTVGETAVSTYDPSKAYLYNINPRGLTWFDNNITTTPDALQKLEVAGSEAANGVGRLVIVPADPATPIPEPKMVSPAVVGNTNGTAATIAKKRPSYWVPRHCMVGLLQECIHEQEMDRSQLRGLNETIGPVTLLGGKHFASVTVNEAVSDNPNGPRVMVQTTDGSVYPAHLVVAADGLDSAVRKALAAAAPPASTKGGSKSS